VARRKSPRYAPEALEERLNPSAMHPLAAQVRKDPVHPRPSDPVPTNPTSPTLPPGDGTPPISGPSVPGGTPEPADEEK
jgi:hypothetical protein